MVLRKNKSTGKRNQRVELPVTVYEQSNQKGLVVVVVVVVVVVAVVVVVVVVVVVTVVAVYE